MTPTLGPPPTTSSDRPPLQTCGLVKEIVGQRLLLQLPGMNYELTLQLSSPGALQAVSPNRVVEGLICVRARRVDMVGVGGLFIEPVVGPPRRFQGRIVSTDARANVLLLRCAPECIVRAELTDPRQRASDFQPGQIVAFDAEPGARFEPAC